MVENRKISSNNTSGYKGVHWLKDRNKWRAVIQSKDRMEYLGVFSDPVDAAIAYDNAARELYGEFARLNFPD